MQKMSGSKARMFNRKASHPKSKPDEILAALELQPGQNVADIGAGGGYFSLRFAEAVGPEGRVYAVDTDPQFLQFIGESAREKGLSNVVTILASEDTAPLEAKDLDLVFVRNVYHHLRDRAQYFGNLRGTLKPQGKVAIIDYNGSGFLSFHRISGHYTPKETVVAEMGKAGYELLQECDVLPRENYLIFVLKG